MQDVPTRWGSTLEMISRLLTHKDAILQSLSTHKHNLTLPTEVEWTKLSFLQKLLLPCEKVCKLLGGEKYVTASIVLPIVAYLKKEMIATDDDPGYAAKFKAGFFVDLQTRLDKMECDAVLQVATALDVRFKSLKCLKKEKRDDIWQLIEHLMTDIETEPPTKKPKQYAAASMFSLVESDSDDGIDDSTTELAVELNLYKCVPSEPDIDADPVCFWKTNRHVYPRLSRLAKEYLTIPATSVPVERLFSSAGELITKKRNSISPENANVLLSLSC